MSSGTLASSAGKNREAVVDHDDGHLELMTREHKELLDAHRDELVQHLYPDDVLNRLQSCKVLNSRDVTRIKEKQAIQSQVESLLDTLTRKPDRAYSELIQALNDTDQEHVARILTKDSRHMSSKNVSARRAGPSRSADVDDLSNNTEDEPEDYFLKRLGGDGSSARKRTAGDVRVSLSAADIQLESDYDARQSNTLRRKKHRVDPPDDEYRESLVKQLDAELLETIGIELTNYRRVAASGGCDPKNLAIRKQLFSSIEMLMKFRREITGIYDGSVIICLNCSSLIALTDLWNLCQSYQLQNAVESDFVTTERLARFHLKSFRINVVINEEDYKLCLQELTAQHGLNWCCYDEHFDAVERLTQQDGACKNSCKNNDTSAYLKGEKLPRRNRKKKRPEEKLQAAMDRLSSLSVTPPLDRDAHLFQKSISPDSGISSQPSPVSLTSEPTHAMVLRSQQGLKSSSNAGMAVGRCRNQNILLT